MQTVTNYEISRLKQLANNNSSDGSSNSKTYEDLLERRRRGEPLQHIEGGVYFFDIYIEVNQDVLIPRPETEFLVEEIINRVKRPKKIIDVGTGSGCIGLALAKYFKDAEVHLTDISAGALLKAEENSKNNNIKASVYKSDLLYDVNDTNFDLVVANLPYIPSEEIQSLPNEILHYEPLLALDGGREGLDYIIQLIENAKTKLRADGLLALEIDSRFGNKVKDLVKNYKGVELVQDLTGRDRYVFATR